MNSFQNKASFLLSLLCAILAEKSALNVTMSELEQRPGKRVLPIASIVTFLGFLDTHLLIPVMALYASGLGASIGVVGLIVGLYSIINTPANIFFGRLIDRVGYKVPLIVGLAGDALGMFLYTFCRLPIQLALVRVFHGAAGAFVGPATMSFAASYSLRTRKGRAMSFYGMSLAMASLVGYGLSGVIVSWTSYRTLFLLGAGLLASGALLTLLLPGEKKKEGIATATSSGQTLQQVKGLLGRKGLALSYASIFAQYFTFGGVVTLLPLHMEKLGMGALHVGMSLATFSIVFVLFQLPSGTLSDRAGRLMPIIVGLSLGMVSLAILPWLATFLLLVVVMALYGLAYGLIFPSISALLVDHTLPEERGLATGVFHALLTTGVAIGAPVMGWIGGAVGVQLSLALSSVVMALALVMALVMLKRA